MISDKSHLMRTLKFIFRKHIIYVNYCQLLFRNYQTEQTRASIKKSRFKIEKISLELDTLWSRRDFFREYLHFRRHTTARLKACVQQDILKPFAYEKETMVNRIFIF